MASRMDHRHSERFRGNVKTAMLLYELHKHVETPGGTMTATQVAAALGLLKKTIPDIKALELSGVNGQPLPTDIKILVAEPEPNKSNVIDLKPEKGKDEPTKGNDT